MRRRDVVSFSLIFALGLSLYWPVFSIRPLGGDNLYVLAWVRSVGLADVLRGDAAIYPEWRPLAYLSVWLEYRLFGLEQLPLYFFVNLSAWIACACLVYRIVCDLTGRPAAAVVAGVIPLVDRRSHQALTWIIERQTIFASLFGLTALWLIVRARSRDTSRSERAAVIVLLVAAILSKEHGAAFVLAVALYGWVARRRDCQAIALASLAIYVALRVIVTGGAAGVYCEDMGFGFGASVRCLDPLSLDGLPQMLYNAAAASAASLIAGLLDPAGAIAPAPYRIAISCVLLVLAVYGSKKAPMILVLPAALPLTIGVMGYLAFRPRNVLIGVEGLAIVAGMGLARLDRVLRMTRWHWMPATVAVVLVMALGWKALDAHDLVKGTGVLLNRAEPCASSVRQRAFGASFVPVVKRSLGLPDPDCVDH